MVNGTQSNGSGKLIFQSKNDKAVTVVKAIGVAFLLILAIVMISMHGTIDVGLFASREETKLKNMLLWGAIFFFIDSIVSLVNFIVFKGQKISVYDDKIVGVGVKAGGYAPDEFCLTMGKVIGTTVNGKYLAIETDSRIIRCCIDDPEGASSAIESCRRSQ